MLNVSSGSGLIFYFNLLQCLLFFCDYIQGNNLSMFPAGSKREKVDGVDDIEKELMSELHVVFMNWKEQLGDKNEASALKNLSSRA